MTRKFTFLLMALLALAGLKSWGQTEIQIGNGTQTQANVPFYSYYKYSYTQMLYLGSEIGVSGTINSISFNNSLASSLDGMNFNIYMKCVSKDSYSDNTDWVSVTIEDLVCSTTLNSIPTGWVTFTLDEPFQYDTSQGNLMIAFDNNTGACTDYGKYPLFYYTSTSPKNTCILQYSDGTNVDPTSPSNGNSISSQRPNIKINITPTGLDSHTITYVQPEHGTVSGPVEAYEGQNVTLTATPDADYALEHFIVNGTPITGNTFTMPTSDVTVTATFVYHPTLTVNDGTNTNSYVPIYGLNADNSCKSQFIIPASELESMNDAYIHSMSFYLNSQNNVNFSGVWDVYVTEVDYTTLSGYVDWNELGAVLYNGNMTIANGVLTVNLTTPYQYGGGNLLIGFNETTAGNWVSTSWLGTTQTANTAYAGYGSTNNAYKFLPKTTFEFTPGEQRYNITTVSNPAEAGTIVTDPADKAAEGATITMTATPELGYEFSTWSVKDANDQTVTVTGNTFVMPANNVTVTATFNALQQYDITFVGVDETLITVSATAGGNAITKAPAGTEVTLQYSNLDEGYTFINWTLNGVALAGNTFEMPANDVEIGVALNERPRYAVIIDGSIAHGTVTASPNANILGGKTVTLTVTPADSYVLNTLTVTDAESNPVAVTNNQFTMPESNVTVTATFSAVLSLTVNEGTATNEQVPFYGWNADNYFTKSQFIIPASSLTGMVGGTITDLTFYVSTSSTNKDLTSDTWDIYVKEVNTTEQGTSYVDFAEMTKVYTGTLSVKNYQVTVHFDIPYTYVANAENPNLMIGFNQTTKGSYTRTYWLGVAGNPQNVAPFYSRASYGSTNASFNFLPKTTFTYSNPNLHGITVNQPTEGGEIAASAGAALPGTIITLTATPELGYEFGEWIVSPSTVTITGNTFEMPASDVTVTAMFSTVTMYDITFNLGEYDGLVTAAAKCNGETITEAPEGTEVTLEYTNLNEGYTFGNWTLNGEALPGNTFTMPAEAVEVGVVLNERPRFAVTIDGSITNGTITAEPSSEILGGTLVTLTITPETGYTLDVLTVTDAESNPVAVTNNQFTMPESNVTVTATFVHGITVYDGTNTNNQVPVYGSYADSDYKSQFIFPAEDLEAMAGGIINSMTFYASEEYVAIPGTWSVYVSEVENTTLSGLEDWANLDAVLEGAAITISGRQMTVNFATPFLYNGGNLLIGFKETISGSYTNTTWYGVTQTTNTAYYWYDYYSVSEGPIQFLPKTTFLYTPVTPYTVNLHVNGVVSEEEVSILPTPENIPAGMTFCGWTSSDIATYTTEAPSYVTKATADGEDFYAVFSYTEEEQTRGQNWVKITSPSELVDGEEIVLVYNNNYVVGGRSEYGTNYVKYEAEISDGKIANLPTGATIFTLSGTSGSWKLNYYDIGLSTSTTLSYMEYDGDGYLGYYGIWQSWGGTSYDEWSAEGTSRVIFKNNHSYEYIGEDESVYAELIHSVANANLACEAYKKDVAMVTYYMTEVLTSGEVTDLTTNNIIVASPITVSGRLEMNAAGLFRNEDAAKFVFEDGAQFYYTGEESVMATFKKDIAGYTGDNDNYYLIANPTDEDEVAHLTDNSFDIFTFNPGAALEWKNQQDNAVIEQGTGYLYANSEDVTLQFAGELMPAGETTLTLAKAADGTGLDYPGFNLVGNPFACDAYIDGSFYRMNGTEFVSVANGPISPCEGIFVEASEDGEELAITTTAASKGANLELAISQGRSTVIDRAIVRFDESNDMHKFMMNPAHTNIRLAKNGQEYAAISSETEGEIPVSFMAEKDGSYTISVNTENVEANYLHLIDNMTGMDTDLLSTPSYTFNASTSDYAYRFKLVFNVEIGEANGNNGDSDNFAFMSNGNLVINGIEGEATMQIVDVLGRVVSTEIVSGSYNKALNLRAGLYIINLNGMTQKIVVK